MDAASFDAAIRSLAAGTSRRAVLRGFAGIAFGSVVAHTTGSTDARKGKNKKKRKRKSPPPFNAFGCLDVGQKCSGKNELCCSGICAGKKPKKGKKDKRVCAAHSTGGCTPERSLCANVDLNVAFCSPTAACLTTTGNAGFCAEDTGFDREVNCRPCAKDADCQALGFGAGSACVILITEGACEEGCEEINGSDGTACIAPGA